VRRALSWAYRVMEARPGRADCLLDTAGAAPFFLSSAWSRTLYCDVAKSQKCSRHYLPPCVDRCSAARDCLGTLGWKQRRDSVPLRPHTGKPLRCCVGKNAVLRAKVRNDASTASMHDDDDKNERQKGRLGVRWPICQRRGYSYRRAFACTTDNHPKLESASGM
jgi:hypothetical protein